MFKFAHTYTHRKMLDMTIYVLKSFRLIDGRYKLKVRWGNKRGMDIGITENIEIKREEVKNWNLFVGENENDRKSN